MRIFILPTRLLGLMLGMAFVSACVFDDDLRQFRSDNPLERGSIEWPSLSPIGAFAFEREFKPAVNPVSLAQRAANLRQRAKTLGAPVLSPARKRAMNAALARYYQG